jgi:hemoglobin/transferrin/lactoferrin receptor protein
VNNEITTHYDFNIGTGKWAFLTSITASLFGDLKQGANRKSNIGKLGLRDSIQVRENGVDITKKNDNENLQVATAYNQMDLIQKILYAPNKNSEHILNLQYSTSTDVPRYDRLTEKSKGVFKSAEWYYGPETRALAAYHLNTQKATLYYDKARITAAYQYIEESRHNRNFGSNLLNHRKEYVHILSANMDLMKHIHEHEIRYGLEATQNFVQSNASKENIVTRVRSPQSTRYPDGGGQMSTMAAYLSHSWEINEQIILTEGLRYNWVQLQAIFNDKSFYSFLPNNLKQNNQAINGQLGLVYLPGQNWKWSTSLSTGFRVPNIDDVAKIFDSQSGVQVIVPNPNLKPEESYNLDLGASKLISQKVNIAISGFYTIVNQLISLQHTQVNGSDSILYNGQNTYIVQLQNKERAYIYGGSATVSADLSKNISIVNTLNYTYGRIKTDSQYYPLDHIPPMFGRTGINVFVKNIRSEFFVLYNGWKRIKDYNLLGEDNQQYATPDGMPAWFTLNARINYTYLIHQQNQLQVQIGCENILDRNYRTFASGISAPGRNIYATLRFSF